MRPSTLSSRRGEIIFAQGFIRVNERAVFTRKINRNPVLMMDNLASRVGTTPMNTAQLWAFSAWHPCC
jgi:hypothetical protein